MSGFEIAGIVLGALPIIVKGLEGYRISLNKLSSMRHYEETLDNLLITFDANRARYVIACETLLSPLMLPQDVYFGLINNPASGTGWESKDLEERLKDRLGPAYEPYIGIVRRVHKALLKFAGKMEIEMALSMRSRLPTPATPLSGQSTTQPGTSMSNRVWSRVKTGLESGGLGRLLEGMEKDISTLETLLETSAKLPAIRRDRRLKMRWPPWRAVRDGAESLHRSLAAKWNCSCSCLHTVLLKVDVIAASSEKTKDDVEFDILLSEGSASTALNLEHTFWHSFCVKSRSNDAHLRGVQPIRSSSPLHKQKIQFAFLVTDVDDASLSSPQPPSKPLPAVQEVDDLCSIIKVSARSSNRGFIEGQGWKHTLFRSSEHSPTKTQSAITRSMKIGDLLQCQSRTHQTVSPISTRQKYFVAVTLAVAVLYLFETPWLSSAGSLRDLILVSHQAATLPMSPYLLGNFSAPQIPSLPENKLAIVGVQNQVLFQLGVLLLEIAFEKPLADLRLASELDASGNEIIVTDYLVAVRLANEVVHREAPAYSEAVRRCLFCKFPCTSTELSNIELQEEYYRGVISPLHELYKLFK